MKDDALLVCGHEVIKRVEAIVSYHNLDISLRTAFDKEDVFKELNVCKPPVCIMEHNFGFIEMVHQHKNKLFAKFFGDMFDQAGKNPKTVEQVKGFDLLLKMIEISPETKYVITSHIRGSGITKEEKIAYKKIPEVIKVMGFTNCKTNVNYLLKLFNKLYSCR